MHFKHLTPMEPPFFTRDFPDVLLRFAGCQGWRGPVRDARWPLGDGGLGGQ